MNFPEGRAFAFTVFDDTDNSTVENTRPVYRLLEENSIYTTKSVWVYPPRGTGHGGCLLDEDYRTFVQDLRSRGFEIALHGVGDGAFSREEIAEGLELYRQFLGDYPRLHTNHMANPDCLYWGPRRFACPLREGYAFYWWVRGARGRLSTAGHDRRSPHFWGDLAKRHIKYIRNFTFNGINTLGYDPLMPYRDPTKEEYTNYWFSSSDGHAVAEMTALLAPENLDRLEAEGGACIVYTHFAYGFVDREGRVDAAFVERIRDLGRRNGWFVPVGTLLNHLLARRGGAAPGYRYLLELNLRWLLDRLVKRWHHGAVSQDTV